MKSLKILVFGTWGLEVETKGLDSISEFIPSILIIKNPFSLTVIPLLVIDKDLVEEFEVEIYENPKLESKAKGGS